MLSDFVKRAVRWAGFDVSRHRPSFVDLMRHHGIQVVLDVGANEGQFALELRSDGFRGQIISFEPIAAVHERLAARAARDPKWTTHHLALGATDGSLDIAVSHKTVFSSFKGLSEYSRENFPGARASAMETVEVRRLDEFLLINPLDLARTYLKIDTQGFEREVLDGAGTMLDQVRAVQAELPLRPLYEDQEIWVETIRWMATRGFRTVLAKENGIDPKRNELLELDVVFLNERF